MTNVEASKQHGQCSAGNSNGISDIPVTHQLQCIYNTYLAIRSRFMRLLIEIKLYYNAQTTCIYMRYHDKIHTLSFVAPFVIRIFHSPDPMPHASTPHYWNQNPPVTSQPASLVTPAPPPTTTQPTIHHNATTPPPQPHEHVHTRPASLLVYTVPTPPSPYPSLTAHTLKSPKAQHSNVT